MDRRPAVSTPKPYFSLPLGGAPSRAAPLGHERFRGLTGWLELTIEVQSDFLHAGSGLLELAPDGRAYAAFSRRGEQLVLPATGLKGAVRAIVEAISNSCVSQRGADERVSGQHARCREVRPRREGEAQLCPACRVFGATGWRGRVHFTDGLAGPQVKPQIVKIGALWAPRLAQGRKFYAVGSFQRLDERPERNYRFIEAVPKGSRFTAQLRFESATAAELGLVARGLGLDRQADKPDGVVYALTPKLGGAKPRCLGAVRFRPTRLLVVPSASSGLLAGLAAGGQQRPVLQEIRAWLDAQELLDQEVWKQLKDRSRQADPCPQEVY